MRSMISEKPILWKWLKAPPFELQYPVKRWGLFFVLFTANTHFFKCKEEKFMDFFNSAVTSLSTVVVAIGAGVGVWGIINLMEGYGGDNPASNAHVR